MAFGGEALTTASGVLENAKGIIEKAKEKTDEWKRIIKADQKGWLVCLAVLIVTVVRSGITYSFGSVVVNLKDLFPEVTLTEQSKLCFRRSARVNNNYSEESEAK
jgi:hypothetical protein